MKIILFKMGKSPLTQENIQDLVKARKYFFKSRKSVNQHKVFFHYNIIFQIQASSRDGDRVDYEALVREMMASVD